MSKVYIRTYAYNAEKTLRRAVESVLSQTHGDFIYYLCDNGSTDGTHDLVREYAKRDSRIRPFYNKVNRDHSETQECLNLPHLIDSEDYYCTLDADDEYFPTFFEESLEFMNTCRLDIAACGSDFINAQNRQLAGRRILSQSLILQGQDFERYFTIYHAFMRTVWGKLYKGWVMRNTIIDSSRVSDFPRAYGGDTYNTMLAFGSAKRVGILAKPLHRYYMSVKSVSYQFHPQRVKTDQILHKATLEYLAPYGPVSARNEDFLFAVYMNALKDTWNVLLGAKVPTSEKIKGLYEIYCSPYTRQFAAKRDFGAHIGQEAEMRRSRGEFFASVVNWLLSVGNVSREQAEQYCDIGDFFCAALEFSDGWLSFQKLRIRFLMEENRVEEAAQKVEELRLLIPDDADVLKFMRDLGTIKC